MKKWRCTVCDYHHEEDTPPAECPVCSADREEFVLEPGTAATETAKRWKCIVCDYVHVGAEPPAVCPVCGVGRENFVLLEDITAELTPEALADTTEGTARSALDKLSYGLYVLTSYKERDINGQCVNTVFQLTSQPLRIAVCINKNNLTHEYLMASGVFAVSILSKNHFDKVGVFGYRSGRTVDKFTDINYLKGQNGCPILTDCLAYLEARVLPEKSVDVGTHTLFVADVTAGRLAINEDPLTYTFYRANKTRKSLSPSSG